MDAGAAIDKRRRYQATPRALVGFYEKAFPNGLSGQTLRQRSLWVSLLVSLYVASIPFGRVCARAATRLGLLRTLLAVFLVAAS
jgi:hypothetical protein